MERMQKYTLPQGPAPGTKSKATDVLMEFGLIGAFSDDCANNPPQTWWRYIPRLDGMVVATGQLAQGPQGVGGMTRYLLIDAEKVSETEVKIRAYYSPWEGELEVRFIKGPEGFRRLSSLQLLTNEYLIKDSVHRGYTYPWMKPCTGGRS